MYLGSYRFNGDPDQLLARYDTMFSQFPVEAIMFHACVRTADGITVFDACPDLAQFRAFASSAEFRGALDGVGLPEPTVTEIGTVHTARAQAGLLTVT